MREIECGEWCPIFYPEGECVARDPGEHCAIFLVAILELDRREGGEG